jgi:hypothetical protein
VRKRIWKRVSEEEDLKLQGEGKAVCIGNLEH